MTRPPEVIAASGEVKDWISVDDRLPTTTHRVLACNALGYIGAAQWDGKHWNHIGKATHWMPMPAMPSPKTALQPFADEVEASGEPEKHAVLKQEPKGCWSTDAESEESHWVPASPSAATEELDLIDVAISHLQQARSALNREQPETATGRGYVQDARAALAKVQS